MMDNVNDAEVIGRELYLRGQLQVIFGLIVIVRVVRAVVHAGMMMQTRRGEGDHGKQER